MKKYIILSIFALSVLMFSCSKDSLDAETAQSKTTEDGISTVDDLQGILAGAYNRMTQTDYYGRDMMCYGELRSDNMYTNGNSGRYTNVSSMYMTTADGTASATWTRIYQVVASANLVISMTDKELEGDDADQIRKANIIGQAYAIRALAHFDLLRLYGQQHVTNGNDLGIPYVKEFRSLNNIPARNTVQEVKTFIYDDLTTALTYLVSDLNPDSKHFISTYAVDAIRARVAVYFGDWTIAKTACETIISSGEFSIVSSGSFVASWAIKHPVNSIFELAYSASDQIGNNSIQFIYRGSTYGDVRALDNLLAIFEAGDVRGSSAMIDYDPADPSYLTCMGKYPSANYSDNIFLFRYEEVILNYAEALFEINNADPNALTNLNLIPSNRNATPYAVISKDNILLERRKEFCFEGFRFDDLARTHKDMPFVEPDKQTLDEHGVPLYGAYNYAFPIPISEITANPNMVQNYGYLN